MTTATDDAKVGVFDRLYGASADPWGTRTRWYERRKRALLMASLPHEHYVSVYEAGCGTGHISLELSTRATHLLASDTSTAAVSIAQATLHDRDNVSVERHTLPADWPDRAFDLVVLGELLYFVGDREREAIAASAARSAGDDGLVVACDWRHAIGGMGLSGDQAHRRFETALEMPRAFEYEDDDFVLTGWCRNRASVASREGLR